MQESKAPHLVSVLLELSKVQLWGELERLRTCITRSDWRSSSSSKIVGSKNLSWDNQRTVAYRYSCILEGKIAVLFF